MTPEEVAAISPEVRRAIEDDAILRMIHALVDDDPEAVVCQQDPEADLPKLMWFPKAMHTLWEQLKVKEP